MRPPSERGQQSWFLGLLPAQRERRWIPKLLSASAQFVPQGFAGTYPEWGAVFHLEIAAKLLKLLELIFDVFSKCALKSLNNQADFDSAILRFDQEDIVRKNQDLAARSGRSFGTQPLEETSLGRRTRIPVSVART